MSNGSDRCPMHPGELLREEVIPASRTSKASIARMLGISRQHLYAILAEKSPVSPAVAIRLARLFGGSAHSWVQMQGLYDIWKAARDIDVSAIKPLETVQRQDVDMTVLRIEGDNASG